MDSRLYWIWLQQVLPAGSRAVSDLLDAFGENINKRFDSTNRKIAENYSEILKNCKTAFEKQDEEIDDRFSAIMLSYAEAQQAADKVNDFASSLASIFDYDPLEAVKRGRTKEAR